MNARGLDSLNLFKNVADIAIQGKVDVLLIVGDFFTRVSPNPRYMLEAIREPKQVVKVGITVVIVSGNHGTPRISTTLNPIALEPTTFSIGGYEFVCMPAQPNFDEIKNLFGPLLAKALQDLHSGKRILAAHIPLGQATTSF